MPPLPHLLALPESDRGLLFARNWIRDLAESEGRAKHWQFDDNIGGIRRLYAGRRIPADAGPAIRVVEDFTDRFENVALSGFNYQMFVTPASPRFRVNCHVYSATLVNHACELRWRLLFNDDSDLCLQVLGRSTLFAGDEDHIVLEHLEYSLVAPAGHAGERDLRKPEQLRQISLDPRNDLDLRGQPKPPSASLPPPAGAGQRQQCYNPILVIARSHEGRPEIVVAVDESEDVAGDRGAHRP